MDRRLEIQNTSMLNLVTGGTIKSDAFGHMVNPGIPGGELAEWLDAAVYDNALQGNLLAIDILLFLQDTKDPNISQEIKDQAETFTWDFRLAPNRFDLIIKTCDILMHGGLYTMPNLTKACGIYVILHHQTRTFDEKTAEKADETNFYTAPFMLKGEVWLKAATYYRRAFCIYENHRRKAVKGNPRSMECYGSALAGSGELVKAWPWWEGAARKGNFRALMKIFDYVEEDFIHPSCSEKYLAAINELHKLSVEWLDEIESCHTEKDADLLFLIALAYETKLIDFHASHLWHLLAAPYIKESAIIVGEASLGHDKKSVNIPRKTLLKWAYFATTGDPDAMFRVGLAFEHGFGGTVVDYTKAIYWIETAALWGNTTATEYIAGIYSGAKNGFQADTEKMIYWINRLSLADSAEPFDASCPSPMGCVCPTCLPNPNSELNKRLEQPIDYGFPPEEDGDV